MRIVAKETDTLNSIADANCLVQRHYNKLNKTQQGVLKGRSYTVYYYQKKINNSLNRFLYGCAFFLAVISTLGVALSLEKIRELGSMAWKGKKTIKVWLPNRNDTPLVTGKVDNLLRQPIETPENDTPKTIPTTVPDQAIREEETPVKKVNIPEISLEEGEAAYTFLNQLLQKYMAGKNLALLHAYDITDFKPQEQRMLENGNPGQLIYACSYFKTRDLINYPGHRALMSALVSRWKSLEAKGIIAPPSGDPDFIFLDLKLDSLNAEEQGLSVAKLNEHKATSTGKALLKVIENWQNRHSPDKTLWHRTELAETLKISPQDLASLCYRLQIFQTEIPTELLKYVFRVISLAIQYPNEPVNFQLLCSPSLLAEGTTLYALGNHRFPGITFKDTWSMEELSMYLAVNKEALFLWFGQKGLIPNAQGNYLTEDIMAHISSIPPMSRTQENSIRFAISGRS